MIRRDEVEKRIMGVKLSACWTESSMEDLARTLAAEVDQRDATITALLEMLRPLPDEDPSPYWQACCERCGWFGLSSSCEEESPGECDTNVLCPECGECVDELNGRREDRIAATYARALEIAGRTE